MNIAIIIALILLLVACLALSVRCTRLEEERDDAIASRNFFREQLEVEQERYDDLYDRDARRIEDLNRSQARLVELERQSAQLIDTHLGRSLQRQAYERLGIKPNRSLPLNRGGRPLQSLPQRA